MHRSERSYDVHQELALTQQELAHQRAESRRKSARMDKVEALVAEAYKELEASLKREQSLREKLATNDRRWKEEVEALMQQLPIPNEQEEQEQISPTVAPPWMQQLPISNRGRFSPPPSSSSWRLVPG